MCVAQGCCLRIRFEHATGIFSDTAEKNKATFDGSGAYQDRLCNERRQHLEFDGAHGHGSFRRKGAGKHREPFEGAAFGLVEQTDAPGDDVAERSVTCGRRPIARTKPIQAFVELPFDVGQRQRAEHARRELKRERQTVEPIADGSDALGRRRETVSTPAGATRAVREQVRGILGRQRLQCVAPLGAQTERLSSRRDDVDVRRRFEQAVHEPRTRFCDLLAVVQQQQCAAVAQHRVDTGKTFGCEIGWYAERARERVCQCVAFGNG